MYVGNPLFWETTKYESFQNVVGVGGVGWGGRDKLADAKHPDGIREIQPR